MKRQLITIAAVLFLLFFGTGLALARERVVVRQPPTVVYSPGPGVVHNPPYGYTNPWNPQNGDRHHHGQYPERVYDQPGYPHYPGYLVPGPSYPPEFSSSFGRR